MRYEFYSRKLKRTVEFSRPGPRYIFIDLNGHSGTLGQQICDGGTFGGGTEVYYGDDINEFKRICKNWWKLHLKKYKDYYDYLDCE